MHALWLVRDCSISCYNHLMQGDYSKRAKFQNGCLTFGQCFRKSSTLNRIKLDSFAKSTKDIKDLKTLFERKIWNFSYQQLTTKSHLHQHSFHWYSVNLVHFLSKTESPLNDHLFKEKKIMFMHTCINMLSWFQVSSGIKIKNDDNSQQKRW